MRRQTRFDPIVPHRCWAHHFAHFPCDSDFTRVFNINMYIIIKLKIHLDCKSFSIRSFWIGFQINLGPGNQGQNLLSNWAPNPSRVNKNGHFTYWPNSALFTDSHPPLLVPVVIEWPLKVGILSQQGRRRVWKHTDPPVDFSLIPIPLFLSTYLLNDP